MADQLDEAFQRQTEFMQLLRDADKMPEWPVDLTSKPGQRLLKEVMLNLIEELMEASFTLKNRTHRITDARQIDIDHFREELGDTFAYFMEICILAGFGPEELFKEYCRKNQIVRQRLENGY
ncbi:MAG: dUTP diphosphatase [Acidiferrobacterales bacterium]